MKNMKNMKNIKNILRNKKLGGNVIRISVGMLMLVLLASCVSTQSVTTPVASATPSVTYGELVNLVENANSAIGYRYSTKDSQGNSMDTAKIIDNPSGGYLAVYHTGTTVKLAISTDILNWAYKKDLEINATQPTIYSLSNGGFLVAFEKHNNGGSVKINYYKNLNDLYTGTISKSYNAVRTIGKVNEGTPNIYSATLNPDIDHSTIDIGFHYQSAKSAQCSEGPDRQARGTLTNFNSWSATTQPDIDNAIIPLITPCTNIGDRDGLNFNGISYSIHEAGGGPALANFDKWRIFLYNPLSKTAVQLNMNTPKGGVVFANPTFSVVRNPKDANKQVLVDTLFVPMQNGKDPAGTYVYYKDMVNTIPTIQLSSITVASPNSGESWKHGTTHTISWTKTGNPGTNVKIELINAGVLSRTITLSTSNDGSYSWAIPATQTPGTNYKIRITSTGISAYNDSSNNNFMIT